ncbi:MAG: biotin--[acetyl-CoA-carboxylase] ligase [Actinomycetota bacterium]
MATRYAFVELDTTGSTQDEARERFDGADPVVVVARRQTSGRGRLGRVWEEPDLALFTSLAFEPLWPVESRSLIPLVAGLSARSSIEALSGIAVDLRWPNDLMIGDVKVGGLLAESSGDVVVVGCGVNLAWSDPMEGATSLADHGARPVEATDLARAWADHLLERLSRHPDQWGLDEYRRSCITIGQSVAYRDGSGAAIGVSDEGALLVETSAGVVAVSSGEVRVTEPATIPDDREGR